MYDEESEIPRFDQVEKSSALQNCKVFNNAPINVDECTKAMVDLLYLIYTGRAELTEDEATDVFFMSTKLMQCSNVKLRRLHYILIKELSPLVEASYVAFNSIMSDMKNSSELIRRNALRVLLSVTDPSMLHNLDRTIAECINSKNAEMVNSALVTGIHLARMNPEVPKKWSNQLAQQRPDAGLSHYSRVALLHSIRTNDRLSAQRLLDDVKNGVVRTPLAICLIVNICAGQLQHALSRKDSNMESEGALLKFVVSMTHHHNELIAVEACRAICSLPNLTDKDVAPAATTLGSRLNAYNIVTRFTSMSLLYQLAMSHPDEVRKLSGTLESFIGDSHRGVSTLVILTLLLIGSEDSVTRLLTQLSVAGALKGLDDNFKILIVEATLNLHRKFPNGLEAISNFLFAALGEVHSGYQKQRIVDTMIELSKADAASKESILTKLADSIDDCDYPAMTKRVLAHMADEVPHSATPRKYIRYIYNHCQLEQADIRAVAVRTLAKIAAKLPALRGLILPLLSRCYNDEDDEVRDRSLFYSKLLRTKDERLISTHIIDVADQVAQQRRVKLTAPQLRSSDPASAAAASGVGSPTADLDGSSSATGLSGAQVQARDALCHIAPLRELGAVAKTCKPELLTDTDNEYVVTVFRHYTAKNIILQFSVHNTMDVESFASVSITCDTSELEEGGAEPKFTIPIPHVLPGQTGYAYMVLEYDSTDGFPYGEVPCTIHFAIADGEDELPTDVSLEEVPIGSFSVDLSDYLKQLVMTAGAFEKKWEAIGEGEETAGVYELQSMRNLTDAVHEVASFFGLYVVGGVPEVVTTASHVLQMSGSVVDAKESTLLISAKSYISTTNAVVLQLVIRGADEGTRTFLSNALMS